MCGIYGGVWYTAFGKQRFLSSLPVLRESSRLRGRDGWGEKWWDNGCIGAARAQPLTEGESVDVPVSVGGAHVVFNGIISNDDELANRYGIRRYDVDTVTLAHLWIKLGIKCFEEIVGGFAIAIWDEGSRKLVIAKNYKCLWYISTPDLFMFASEKKFFEQISLDPFSDYYPRRFPLDTVLLLDVQTRSREIHPIPKNRWGYTPELDEGKALVVTSGGMDSITSAWVAKKLHNRDVKLLHFDYGQRSETREREAVYKCAERLQAPVEVIDLRQLGRFGSSPLTDTSIDLPLGMKSVESTLCWVPARNLLMIAYAAALAEAEGRKWIYYGNNLEEEATGYSDNDVDFIETYNDLLEYGTLRGVKICRALARIKKSEIVLLGNYLGVPFEYTWSCDLGGEKPCGRCGCCTTRRYAFRRAGISDPQEYEQSLVDVYPWDTPSVCSVGVLVDIVRRGE